jgi:hypothetical protein
MELGSNSKENEAGCDNKSRSVARIYTKTVDYQKYIKLCSSTSESEFLVFYIYFILAVWGLNNN